MLRINTIPWLLISLGNFSVGIPPLSSLHRPLNRGPGHPKWPPPPFTSYCGEQHKETHKKVEMNLKIFNTSRNTAREYRRWILWQECLRQWSWNGGRACQDCHPSSLQHCWAVIGCNQWHHTCPAPCSKLLHPAPAPCNSRLLKIPTPASLTTVKCPSGTSKWFTFMCSTGLKGHPDGHTQSEGEPRWAHPMWGGTPTDTPNVFLINIQWLQSFLIVQTLDSDLSWKKILATGPLWILIHYPHSKRCKDQRVCQISSKAVDFKHTWLPPTVNMICKVQLNMQHLYNSKCHSVIVALCKIFMLVSADTACIIRTRTEIRQ